MSDRVIEHLLLLCRREPVGKIFQEETLFQSKPENPTVRWSALKEMKRAMTRRRKIPDTRYGQLLIRWHRKPKEGTLTLMTSAAAYSHFGKAMQGLWISRNCVRRIPLWCSRMFLTAQGRPCFCRALSKARVLTVGDIISPSGDIRAHLLAKVASSSKDLYERRLTVMASAIKNGTRVQIPGRTLPELES